MFAENTLLDIRSLVITGRFADSFFFMTIIIHKQYIMLNTPCRACSPLLGKTDLI